MSQIIKERYEYLKERYVLLRLVCAKCPPVWASVVIAVTFVACGVSDPTRPGMPVTPDEAPSFAAPVPTCPTFDEACAEGRDAVESQCAKDEKHKNNGEYKKCVRNALRSYLNDIEPCFSPSELNAVRRCVLQHFPEASLPSGNGGKKEFHSDE